MRFHKPATWSVWHAAQIRQVESPHQPKPAPKPAAKPAAAVLVD